jgi:3-hydroxyacyl-CoA dehydrogenase
MGYQIHQVAVLGAGTMGGAIAALAANVGLSVDLLDIVPLQDRGRTKMQSSKPALSACSRQNLPR